jgi:hypothetical protein
VAPATKPIARTVFWKMLIDIPLDFSVMS